MMAQVRDFHLAVVCFDFHPFGFGLVTAASPAFGRAEFVFRVCRLIKVRKADSGSLGWQTPTNLSRQTLTRARVLFRKCSGLQNEAIPLVVLIDSHGKIVYYDFGNDEMKLRKVIAGLGPEFASVATNRWCSGILDG
jgi:hypothetical protein